VASRHHCEEKNVGAYAPACVRGCGPGLVCRELRGSAAHAQDRFPFDRYNAALPALFDALLWRSWPGTRFTIAKVVAQFLQLFLATGDFLEVQPTSAARSVRVHLLQFMHGGQGGILTGELVGLNCERGSKCVLELGEFGACCRWRFQKQRRRFRGHEELD
jgi:hypothetical protein